MDPIHPTEADEESEAAAFFQMIVKSAANQLQDRIDDPGSVGEPGLPAAAAYLSYIAGKRQTAILDKQHRLLGRLETNAATQESILRKSLQCSQASKAVLDGMQTQTDKTYTLTTWMLRLTIALLVAALTQITLAIILFRN